MRGDYSFTPESKSGASKPMFEGEKCRGLDLTEFAHDYANNPAQLQLDWLIDAYQQLHEKNYLFFTKYFNNLAGNQWLKQQIENGKSAEGIRASWVDDLEAFKVVRAKYLIY